jgi:hypothetical protein
VERRARAATASGAGFSAHPHHRNDQIVRELFPAAAALLFAWYPACAQASGDSTWRALSISLGVVQENRRDDADSPLAYAGYGLGARIVYDWGVVGRRGFVSFDAAGSTLTPTPSAQEPDIPLREAFSVYALAAGMDWPLRGNASRRDKFALGVELGATFTLGRHLYAGQELAQQDFDLGVIALAPTGRWSRRMGTGALGASLALPLLAWVDHPYADVRFAQQFADLHFAPLTQFHQANGELSYAFRPEGRFGVTATYRFDIVELNDIQPVRRVSQSISVGIVRRFGGHR